MKKIICPNNKVALLVCAVLAASLASARARYQETSRTVVTAQILSDDHPQAASEASTDQQNIVIQAVEPLGGGKRGKVVAWLGVGTEESTEALSSQLGLKPGEGLTIDFLAADSPAAKADFRKNDVLVEFDGQMLVHPIQFRKLVQMHSEGDTVKVTFYRAGKKQTISVKLGKITWDESYNHEDPSSPSDLEKLDLQLNGLNGELHGMSESLSNAGLNKAKMDVEIKRTMEQTRKAIRDAMRRATVEKRQLDDADRELEGLARDGVDVDSDATIVVRNKHNSNRTIVQTDDSGTYIIESGAKTHLTARDKHGKLLFEGQIDSPAERDKVPKEVWEKVEPMYDQMALPDDGKTKKDEGKPRGMNDFLKQNA